jgi:hypothetical protein
MSANCCRAKIVGLVTNFAPVSLRFTYCFELIPTHSPWPQFCFMSHLERLVARLQCRKVDGERAEQDGYSIVDAGAMLKGWSTMPMVEAKKVS